MKKADVISMSDMSDFAPFVRTPYNYDRDAASDASGIYCDPSTDEGRSKTQQQFTQECDPNFILDRFAQGGDITLNTREPRYGDFTDAPTSYHSALNFIKNTERQFMELPAQIRAKFNNDPGTFLDFLSDPNNTEQAIELGIATARPQTPSEEAKEDRFATKVAKAFKSSVSPSKGDKGDKGESPKTSDLLDLTGLGDSNSINQRGI